MRLVYIRALCLFFDSSYPAFPSHCEILTLHLYSHYSEQHANKVLYFKTLSFCDLIETNSKMAEKAKSGMLIVTNIPRNCALPPNF
jgi:hypothetical protein